MNNCNLCGETKLLPLLNLGDHPIAHRFLSNPGEKEYIHPVTLCFCESCGLVQLVNPISPDMLYANYVCLSSWKHQPHIPRLIEVISQYTKTNKESKILEVGSNDGTFLNILKIKGYQNLVGIEPAKDAQESACRKGLTSLHSYFNRLSAEDYVRRYGKCDLLISRQMLEHIEDLHEFGEALKIVVAPGGYVVIEVPDFACNLDNLDYSLWEEHVNYFTAKTLDRFMSAIGIKVVHSEVTLFSGKALTVIGEYVGDAQVCAKYDYIKPLKKLVTHYVEQWPLFRKQFIQYLCEHRDKGGKTAVYGAGARLCSLVNFVGLGPYIDFIVDDQLEKQNLFMPGSKLPILPSDTLKKQGIDLCLLAVNTECEENVIEKHYSFLERGGRFYSVLPPSEKLPPFWKQLI